MVRAYEKHGWLVYLGLGILWLVVGFSQAFFPNELIEDDAKLILDMSWDEIKASSPAATDFVNWLYGVMGLLKMSWSLLVLAITLTGYRRGEKWAWYTMWLVPALLVINAVFNASFTGDVSKMLEWIPITTISLIGLLLPYHMFFPRKPQST